MIEFSEEGDGQRVGATRCAAGQLFVETQQINVPACRLYRRNGFRLIDVRTDAYSNLPHEIQLLWAKFVADAHRAAG